MWGVLVRPWLRRRLHTPAFSVAPRWFASNSDPTIVSIDRSGLYHPQDHLTNSHGGGPVEKEPETALVRHIKSLIRVSLNLQILVRKILDPAHNLGIKAHSSI